jgi:secondary thiamine-phosphate synthase enzyme
MQKVIQIETRNHDDWRDITAQVQACVHEAGLAEGVVTVFIPHTTAGVAIQENADPPLKTDISEAFGRLFPWDGGYRHGEDNAAAHMKAMLVGPSVQVPFAKKQLQLGTWQAIYLCEFDGPRQRRVVVHVA